jgi:hypothetical protein
MRCPDCHASNPPDRRTCGVCGHRLFAWLGDPFGALDRPAATTGGRRQIGGAAVVAASTPAAPARPEPIAAPPRGGVPWGKVSVIGLLVWLIPLGLLAGLAIWSPREQRGPDSRATVFAAARATDTVVREATAVAASRATSAAAAAIGADRVYRRGLDRWRARDFAAAVDDLNFAIGLLPGSAPPYNIRALARAGLGDYEAALADADRAVGLDRDANNLDTRAYILLKRGRYHAAFADYRQVAGLKGETNLIAANLLGRGLARAGFDDTAGAIADLEAGIRRAEGVTAPDPQLADLLQDGRQTLARLRAQAPGGPPTARPE